jgi:hypothetical protein
MYLDLALFYIFAVVGVLLYVLPAALSISILVMWLYFLYGNELIMDAPTQTCDESANILVNPFLSADMTTMFKNQIDISPPLLRLL